MAPPCLSQAHSLEEVQAHKLESLAGSLALPVALPPGSVRGTQLTLVTTSTTSTVVVVGSLGHCMAA